MSDEVNILANEEIDYAITMVPELSKLFRSEKIDGNIWTFKRKQTFTSERHGRRHRIFLLSILQRDFGEHLSYKIISF